MDGIESSHHQILATQNGVEKVRKEVQLMVESLEPEVRAREMVGYVVIEWRQLCDQLISKIPICET